MNNKFLLLGLLCLLACQRNANKQIDMASKSEEFAEVVNASLDSVEIPILASVSGMTLVDSTLYLTANGSPYAIYSVDASTMQCVDSLFAIGEGTGEYMRAQFTRMGDGRYFITDNNRMRWHLAGRDTIYESGNLTRDVVNDLKEVDFPVMGYVDLKPDGIWLRLRDFRSGENVDSLSVPNYTARGESVNDGFVWDVDSSTGDFVLAFIDHNRLITGKMSSESIDEVKAFEGTSAEGKMYYTDVRIANGKIYALSQKDVDIESISGNSAVEIYNLDGNPVKRIELPAIAQFMCVGSDGAHIILSSATSDILYVLK